MAAAASSSVLAGAVIYNNINPTLATMALGVNDAGHLNFSGGDLPANANAMGIAYRFPDGSFRDATAPGCLCEGWGLAVTLASGAQTSGFASIDNGGSGGLTGGTFSASATRATSQIGLSGAPVVVTHAYGVSLSSSLFQSNVTITNTGTQALSNVVYRRVMDWDVPNTEFSEYVTHIGVQDNLTTNATPGNVLFASNNGFASANPLDHPGEIGFTGGGEGGGGVEGGGEVPALALTAVPSTGSAITTTINVDFIDAGAADHGSVFDFSFGTLEAGASRTFNIFYGAAANEAAALAAINVVNPTVYSLGQSTAAGGGADNDAPTFIFAFGGVGGVAPGSNPENPLLPLVDTGTGVMTFDAPAPRLWYDPPFAKGYTYTLEGGGAFKKVGITSGFGDLTIRLPDGRLITLPSNTTYDFEANGLAPTTFDIIGLNIDTGAPGFDPGTAFPTFLDFDAGASRLLMTPIIEDGGTVPIPGTALLVVTGLAAMGALRRRKPAP
jgi:hypothetical protein